MLLASCHALQVQTVSRANPVVRAADGGGLPSGIGLRACEAFDRR